MKAAPCIHSEFSTHNSSIQVRKRSILQMVITKVRSMYNEYKGTHYNSVSRNCFQP